MHGDGSLRDGGEVSLAIQPVAVAREEGCVAFDLDQFEAGGRIDHLLEQARGRGLRVSEHGAVGLHVVRVTADVGDQEQRAPSLHGGNANRAAFVRGMGVTRTNLRSVSLPGSEMDLPSDEDHRSARDADATYSRVADLPLRIERCELVPLARDTTSGFTKVSIVVRLTGRGHEGQGEDITWDQIDQIEQLRRAGDLSWLRGTRTFDEFSGLLGLADLFPVEPIRESSRLYRRWAFESAALDLALRQNGLSLQDALGRVAKPVTFVVSTRVEDRSGIAPLRTLLSSDPTLRFKLDASPTWDSDLVAELASLACVDVVDMKGHYRNATVAMSPDRDLYRRVIEGLSDAWIEDPAVADDTIALLDLHRDRITWDEPIESVDDIEALPWPPRRLNLKPSRFGSVRRLFNTYDYCEGHGIGAYAGGMFEQGPGRGQLQYLASLFHPDGPNDLAPVEYNLQVREGDLSRTPLPPDPHETGFRWGTYDQRRSIRERLTASD